MLSILIPVYNSEAIVATTVSDVVREMESIGMEFEMVLVDDGSSDNSWSEIKALSKKYSQVKAIRFLKNYGQHTAVLCAIQNSKGNLLLTMDDDGQNPPTEIVKMVNAIVKGGDLIFGNYLDKKHKPYRRLGSKIIAYLNYRIFNKPKGLILTNYRIFTREVAQRVIQHKTHYPYIPGLLLMYASEIRNIPVQHASRKTGESNYSLFTIIKLVSRLLFNYSSYPLKVLMKLGFVVSGLSFIIGLSFLVKALVFGTKSPGWPSLVVLLSFFNGMIIIMLGIMGEYLSRILSQVSTEKLYVIKENLS